MAEVARIPYPGEATIYSDLNMVSPTVSPLAVNDESIYQSLDNIFGTWKGERFFNSKIGWIEEEYIHAPLCIENAFSIRSRMIEAVIPEVRVVVSEAESYVDIDYTAWAYKVHLVFQVQGLDSSFTYSFSIPVDKPGS